ncbi:hypothetical protein [Chryseobacterium sp. SIMBA_038]|uniref:hypothetical protein n=1 Tax=Chryseobacterium sp. SIMBA_038 TaxID=3085780 RepID=UPI00397B0830
MKNKIFNFLCLFMVVFLNAQNNHNDNQLDFLIKNSSQYGLSLNQKNKIIALKKEAALKFESIGRNRYLSGIEKGNRKRQISMNLYKNINAILTPKQLEILERDHHYDAYKAFVEDKSKKLEEEYKKDINHIKVLYKNDKDLMKLHKNKRKEKYKRDKKNLKNNRI